MSTTEDLIGRADLNDLEAILSVSAPDREESIRAVRDNADAIFTWDYEKGARPALNKLYEKAKVSMWNGETDLPWDTVVDQEEVARNNQALAGGFENLDLSTPPSPSGATRSGRTWAWSSRTGASASSCTASRVR